MRGFISSNNCWLYDRYIVEFPQKMGLWTKNVAPRAPSYVCWCMLWFKLPSNYSYIYYKP